MDFETVSNAVANLGFPIVAVFLLLYILYKEQTKHEEEIDNLTNALNNNTNVMLELKLMVDDIHRVMDSIVNRLERLEGRDE